MTDHTLTPVATTAREDLEPIAWRDSPVDRRGWLTLLATAAIGIAAYTIVGLLVVGVWENSRFGEAEADLSRWLEERRTDGLTRVTEWVSMASDTATKVALGVIFLPLFLWLYRRWHEWVLIVGGLVVEVTVYGLSARLVGRERPPVEQLDGSPSGISWPSGHIAAATVFYGGLAIVVFMHTRRRSPRIVWAIIGVGMPLAMAWARIYLGMHYLTDAIGGLVLGAAVLAVMYRVVHREPAIASDAGSDDASFDAVIEGAER